MKKIIIETIESQDQRYPTCGDYWEEEDAIHFRITKQEKEEYEILIFVHEFIEFMLTRDRGIHEGDITKYDIQWNKEFEEGHDKSDEPGNEHDCIYKKEHRFAENIERALAHEMGIDWFEYDKKLII